jgi:hypothetical protein
MSVLCPLPKHHRITARKDTKGHNQKAAIRKVSSKNSPVEKGCGVKIFFLLGGK